MRTWISSHTADVVDFLVYVIVLNLAIEFFPSVISETFTLSLLTALLLKVALELVLVVKGRVLAHLKAAGNHGQRIAFALMLWGVAVGSKLLVLWVIDLVFSGYVSLGGFIPVTVLVITLLLSRAAVRRLLF